MARHEHEGQRIEQTAPAADDMGWADAQYNLVEGISNEEVWMLLRRLNKTTFHVKQTPNIPPGELDLNKAAEQQFGPNKMRQQMERLYMGVVLGMISCVKHLARLRSWNEKRRTAAFCFLYFLAWTFDYLALLIFTFCFAMVFSPEARSALFPPAPIAIVDSSHGGLTKPNAGVLGSTDSATGAPQNLMGEAVENEAGNFVTALTSIAVNIATGNDPQGEPDTEESKIRAAVSLSPNQVAMMVASAKDKSEGVDKPSYDKTKHPMQTIMWSKVNPSLHAMTWMSDEWERLANLLSPRPPFHLHHHRLRFAGMFLPVLAVSILGTRDFIITTSTFVAGVLLFCKPVMLKLSQWLNRDVTIWHGMGLLESTLLKGVPTNSQLALALLRIAETNHSPLPPSPRPQQEPSHEPLQLSSELLSATAGDNPLGATESELRDAIEPRGEVLAGAGGNDAEYTKEDSNERHTGLGIGKLASKAMVKTAIGIDRVRAKTGNSGAKNRAGVVPSKSDGPNSCPFEFEARFEGQRGYIYVESTVRPATVSFNRESIRDKDGHLDHSKNCQQVWTIPIDEIVEVKKHAGYGFKSQLVAGWALDKELSNSLAIIDRQGVTRAVTAIPFRDALFRRLIAIGDQKWELW